MKVISGSKTVDLTKKLTVEMTLGELAMLTAVMGNETNSSVRRKITGSSVIITEYTSEIQRLDDDKLYSEMASVLRDEGVAE